MLGAQPKQYYRSKPPRYVTIDQGWLVPFWQNKDDTGQRGTQHKDVATGNAVLFEGSYTDKVLPENISDIKDIGID